MQNARKVVIIGFGNIGQAVIPLLQRTFPQWPIIAVDQHGNPERVDLAKALGITLITSRITESNFRNGLYPLLSPGDFLLNLASAVSSCALIRLAHEADALYLDTGIEPWEYDLASASSTSNYALREQMLTLKRNNGNTPTALVAHGANPGFVSVLVKAALLEMARKLIAQPDDLRTPATRSEWAALAAQLDVRVIQISERDTQRTLAHRDPGVFVNTWSVDGFVAECLQEAELGWGTHEGSLPVNARTHRDGCRAAIQLDTRGHETVVKTWTPLHGEFSACVLTHNESISIADYLTLENGGNVAYRPTVYYAYRPTDSAIQSLSLLPEIAHSSPEHQRVLKHDIADGIDELGVLVMSGLGVSLWLGSALSIDRARAVAPLNNATSLQVVSSIVGGMKWMLDHPRAGIVESDHLDHVALLEAVLPYWEPIQCRYTDWTPDPLKRDLVLREFLQPRHSLESHQAHEPEAIISI
ncbi:saccharopine dehydrogenase NADP-binding domain-containing protein [Burkholderia sp. Ac-20365]|jgi:homospermidine synthase|uniref:saccharopine dehydrogenase NADP-binding domain-containing protein n=1 Tax=Burkholderia sp. Ac-20365 TaxID=2703897 RepID=UPI00197B5A64|nr:saccharopine dehydrogenase NADP-binding domain-containing protein [Burkholderia sp. Ac-20365]MBN3759857.1 homospermidine synthase [Burkholderia sp. Ac-20365]